jgi:hypothetical protein
MSVKLVTKNRILLAVENQKANIAKRLADGKVTEAQVESIHKAMDMDFIEFARFQELKSALMGVALTTDEAQTIYGYLGNTPEHFNAQPIEVKVVLTQIFKELLQRAAA